MLIYHYTFIHVQLSLELPSFAPKFNRIGLPDRFRDPNR